MPFVIKAGTPAPRKTDPIVSNTYNKYGLYPWSIFHARCSSLAGSTVVDAEAVNNDLFQLLLFTSDVPINCKVITGKGTGATSPYINDAYNVLNAGLILNDVQGGSGADSTVINYGKVFSGYSGDAYSVELTGFAMNAAVLVNGGGSSETSSIDVECISNAAVLKGPIASYEHGVAGTPTAPQPIVLLYTDYTQAIFDNNNVYVDGSGGCWLIVGLYRNASD
jgi:hypothetical protein